MRQSDSLSIRSADLLDEVRRTSPLIQCLTNSVVEGFTANALLALGASPVMGDVPSEAGPLAEIASGMLINTGTPHSEQRTAMVEAAEAAHRSSTPWVLDPVAVGTLEIRTTLARGLLQYAPTAVRGNPSEIIGLTGLGGGGRGTDAVDEPDDALAAAAELQRACGAVTAISGPTDLISSRDSVIRSTTGDPLLTKVTGGGCALGAITAAFLAVTAAPDAGAAGPETGASGPDAVAAGPDVEPDDVTVATAAATSVYTIASELAAAQAAGPGSFVSALLDALAAVDAPTVRERAGLS